MLPTRAGRNPRRKPDRLIEILGLDNVEARKLFLGLGKGPSVIDILPLRTRTVVAVWTDCSASEARQWPLARIAES